MIQTEIAIACILIFYVAASLSLTASGAWFCWTAPLLPRLLAPDSPVPMNSEEASWMVSCIELGNLISPFPATFFSDHFGRKLCILMSVPFFFVSSILVIYVKTVLSLCLARTIQGFAMGIPYTILPLYLGEIASPATRGRVMSFFHIAWGFGCLLPYCVGPLLSYYSLTYFCLILTLVFLMCFIWQPESPYYLAIKEDAEETEKVLVHLRNLPSANISIQNELADIQLEVKKSFQVKASWSDLIATSADRRALTLIFVVGTVSFLSGQNAILTYTTETFSDYFENPSLSGLVSIGVGFAALTGSIFSIFTSDQFGRRFLLLFSSIGCTFSLLSTSVYFYLHSNTNLDLTAYSWVAPVAVMGYNWFVTAGMHPVCVMYTSELFHTKTRGLASGVSSINLTFCSFIVLKFYLSVSAALGFYFIYLCYALVCLIGTILFYFFMPETKGKTFLEIRECLLSSYKN